MDRLGGWVGIGCGYCSLVRFKFTGLLFYAFTWSCLVCWVVYVFGWLGVVFDLGSLWVLILFVICLLFVSECLGGRVACNVVGYCFGRCR